jgi:hypothetical protein
MLAKSSSLLLSCTRVDSLRHDPLDWFPERVFGVLSKRDPVQTNLVHIPVVQLVALANEIDMLVGIG